MPLHRSPLRESPPGALPDPAAPDGRQPLHESLFQGLKQALIVGDYRPGDRLPLRSLAREKGVSLIPVRDALQRLEGLGALTGQPGQSMQVPHLSAARLADIRELRLAVETLAIRRLCTGRGELAALAPVMARLATATREGALKPFLYWNWRFHMGLAEAAGSDSICAALDPLWPQLGPSIAADNPSAAELRGAGPVHDRLWQALGSGDEAAALAAIGDDVYNRMTPLP